MMEIENRKKFGLDILENQSLLKMYSKRRLRKVRSFISKNSLNYSIIQKEFQSYIRLEIPDWPKELSSLNRGYVWFNLYKPPYLELKKLKAIKFSYIQNDIYNSKLSRYLKIFLNKDTLRLEKHYNAPEISHLPVSSGKQFYELIKHEVKINPRNKLLIHPIGDIPAGVKESDVKKCCESLLSNFNSSWICTSFFIPYNDPYNIYGSESVRVYPQNSNPEALDLLNRHQESNYLISYILYLMNNGYKYPNHLPPLSEMAPMKRQYDKNSIYDFKSLLCKGIIDVDKFKKTYGIEKHLKIVETDILQKGDLNEINQKTK